MSLFVDKYSRALFIYICVVILVGIALPLLVPSHIWSATASGVAFIVCLVPLNGILYLAHRDSTRQHKRRMQEQDVESARYREELARWEREREESNERFRKEREDLALTLQRQRKIAEAQSSLIHLLELP